MIEEGSRTARAGRGATNGENVVAGTKKLGGKGIDEKHTEKSCDEYVPKPIARGHRFENEARSDNTRILARIKGVPKGRVERTTTDSNR